jgi:hypothetical protein
MIRPRFNVIAIPPPIPAPFKRVGGRSASHGADFGAVATGPNSSELPCQDFARNPESCERFSYASLPCQPSRHRPALLIRVEDRKFSIGVSSGSWVERIRIAQLCVAFQQPRQMFFIAASVRAFSALSGSTYLPGSDADCVLRVADLSAAMGGDILS